MSRNIILSKKIETFLVLFLYQAKLPDPDPGVFVRIRPWFFQNEVESGSYFQNIIIEYSLKKYWWHICALASAEYKK